MDTPLEVVDAGRMGYEAAFNEQRRHHAEVLAWRDGSDGARPLGRLLLVEHDPVITVSRKAARGQNLVASAEHLARLGVEVCETDRGGDITYHGPGQLVAYPIVDLKRARLGLHDYLRALEQAVLDTLGVFGIRGHRDDEATGVWVTPPSEPGPLAQDAKVCAMGVRVSRWVTMHGLALNVTTNLDHFSLIVPCGLQGRGVTSMRALLGDASCPGMAEVKRALVRALQDQIGRGEDHSSASAPSA